MRWLVVHSCSELYYRVLALFIANLSGILALACVRFWGTVNRSKWKCERN